MWYALIVAALSLLGAAVPLRFRPSHAGLQVYLSLAAGALLGAALFHLLPHAAEHLHLSFGLPAVLGILVVFLLQRYLAPHSHEIPQSATTDEDHHEHVHTSHARHGADHDLHCDGHEPARPGVRPSLVSGAMAIVGLSIHSLFDGVAIAAAVGAREDTGSSLALAVFLSVLIHKPMDGLSVSALLLNMGMERRSLWTIQVVYAALVPLGAGLFSLTEGSVATASTLVGYTLAFSGGTFLAIALTDLLPELHFHSHDRNKLSAALLFGLLVMWTTSFFGHGHENGAAGDSPREQHEHHDHSHP